MGKFSNTLANARRVKAPAQSPQAVAIEQGQRKITQEQEATPTIAPTATDMLNIGKLTPAPTPETEGVVATPTPAPSQMEQTEALMGTSAGVGPAARQVAQRGITDIEGQTSFDPAIAEQAVQEEQAAQYAAAPVYTQEPLVEGEEFFDYRSTDQLKKRFENATSTRDALMNVVNTGFELREKLDETFRPTLDDFSEPAQNVKNTLAKNNLIDTTTNQLQPKVANALTIQLLENIQDYINKRDDRAVGNYNASQSDNVSLFDPEEPAKVQGQILNSDYTRGTLARGVIGKLVQAPNQTGQTVTGYGDAGVTLDPEAADYLDTLMWNAVKEMGFLEYNTDGESEFYRMSEGAENFFNNSRELLADIQPEKRIDTSSVPTVEGESVPGFERLKGKKTGPVSQKSKLDENMVIERQVKNNLGRMPLRIVEDRYNFAMQVVASVIQVAEDGKTITGLAGQSDTGFFSTEPWASMIGLDEKKWMKAYNRALKTHNGNEGLATEQADRVVRREAKKIFQTMIDGDNKDGKVFYNKWFHASSVGRYFVRNTILNYQDSKLVRNFVGSAKRFPLNLNNATDSGSKILSNWKYIIGKNLLKPSETGVIDRTGAPVKTEDMTWKAIERASNKVINDPSNPIYQKWYSTGNKLRTIKDSDFTNVEALNELVGPDFLEDFQDPAEWGYKLQSLIDFANYVDAKAKAKQNPNAPSLFEPQAQTQHDGKQNGIAIQAMQLGDVDLLASVGTIYSAKEGAVIPEGDIRKRYVDMMPLAIKKTFEGLPEKIDLWNTVLDSIDKHEDRKAITRLISRTPLMEVSYGKDPSFNHDTVIDFLNGKYGDIVQDAIRVSEIENYERKTLIEDFNSLIKATLTDSIPTTHQKTLQDMGMLWSMMGKTPTYKGPLGTNIFLGSTEWTDTGRTVPIPTPEGVVFKTIRRATPTGSARSKSKKILNKETGFWETQKPSRYGQEVANQLPVISVQQIDAAIMAKTINDINNGRKEPLFMLPVHDAIITDASSVDQYHQRINKNFVEVNKQYSLANNILNGYNEAKSVFQNTVNPNGVYLVSEKGAYRSMHTYLLQKLSELQEKESKIVAPITGRRGPRRGKKQELLDAVKSYGWAEEGANVTGKQLLLIFKAIENYEKINVRFNNWKNNSEVGKRNAFKELAEIVYQYN